MEVKIRELDGLTYLAARCLQKGFPVLLGSRPRVWKYFKKHARDEPIFYIAKDVRNFNKLRTPNMTFFVLDEEGGGRYTLDGITRSYIVPEIDKIAKTFTWSEKYNNFFLDHDVPASKLAITGHPRFDLKKPIFFAYYRDIPTKQNRPQRYVLINSNWSLGNYIAGTDRLKRMYKTLNRDPAVIDETVRRDSIVLKRMVSLAKRIAREHPDITVVLRPHPLEAPEHYKKYFDEPNIQIIKEGNSQLWIVDALAVIHRNCGTGMEAFIAGKPVISYLGPEVEFTETAPILVSDVVWDENAAMERVSASIANDGKDMLPPEERTRRINLLKNVVANIDFDAAEKIASILQEHAEAIGAQSYTLPQPRSLFYRTAKKLRRRLKGDHLKELDLIVKKKFPGLRKTEVEALLAGFRKAIPELPKTRVIEFDIDTFLLVPEG